jgi:lipopolysaccharide transport system permease protein
MASPDQNPILEAQGASTPVSHPALSLFWQLCIREVTETTKGSVLGFLWLALGPLLSMALYVVVFGILFGGSFDQGPEETSLQYALGVYIGLSIVNLLNDTIGRAPALIPSKTNFVKRIIFPLPLLPIVQVSGSAFKWCVNAILWIIFASLLQTITWQAFAWLPVIALPLMLMSLGLGWIISSLSVYFRDIQHITPVISQIIFWSSGVFFSSIRVMEYPPIWNFLKWNPVLLAIENSRHVILWQQPVNLNELAYLWGIGLTIACIGFFLFRGLKDGFAELI